MKKIMVVREPEWGVPVGLRELGHSVDQVKFVSMINKHGRDHCQNYILSKANEYDAVILCKAAWKKPIHTLEDSFIKKLTNKTFTVFWMHDAVLNKKRHHLSKKAALCSLASSPYLNSCRSFKKFGARRIVQIFQGFEEDWCQKRATKRKHNVTFIGSVYGDRSKYLNCLSRHGYAAFNKKCSHEESALFYNHSKICLNLVPGECFSNRSMRVMGSGAFLFSQMNQDLKAAFKDGEELVLWSGEKELINGVRHWLKHSEEREAIAEAGHRVIQNFTWKKQMEKLVRAIDGEVIREGAFKE
jgi:hypothetical protein